MTMLFCSIFLWFLINNLSVIAQPSFYQLNENFIIYDQIDLYATVATPFSNRAYLQPVPTTNGNLIYSITPDLPSGIFLDPLHGTIFGYPQNSLNRTLFDITVMTQDNSTVVASTTIGITIKKINLYVAALIPRIPSRIQVAMEFAISEINKDPDLLGNRGVVIPHYYSTAFNASLTVGNAANAMYSDDYQPLRALFGPIYSSISDAVSLLASAMNVPVISPSATAVPFADKKKYPFFSRTVSGDSKQSAAIGALIKRMGWNEVAVLYQQDMYGNSIARELSLIDSKFSVNSIGFRISDVTDIKRAVSTVVAKHLKVVVIASLFDSACLILSSFFNLSATEMTFIGTDGWSGSTMASCVPTTYVQGSLGTRPATPTTPKSVALLNYCQKILNVTQCQGDYTFDYAYDVVYTFAIAISRLIKTSTNLTGTNLLNSIRSTSFFGASGNVSFNNVTGDRLGYYDILNFNQGQFAPIGSWKEENDNLVFTAQAIFYDNTTRIPLSFSAPTGTNTTTVAISWAVSCIFIIISLLLHYFLYCYRTHAVIKASSPLFCHLILVGSILCFLYIGTRSISKQYSVGCILPPLILGLGFNMAVGALVFKTWRIHKIFNSNSIETTNSALSALLKVGGLILLELLIYALWMLSDPYTPTLVDSEFLSDSKTWTCVSKNTSSWMILLLVPKGILLFYGAHLAFKVRNVESNFNESRYLGAAITNVITIIILLFPTLFLPDSSQVIVLVGVTLATFNVVGVIFGPKMYNIWISEEWKLNEKNTFITASEGESAVSRQVGQGGGGGGNNQGGSNNQGGGGSHNGHGPRYTGSPPASLILKSSPKKDMNKPALMTHFEDPRNSESVEFPEKENNNDPIENSPHEEKPNPDDDDENNNGNEIPPVITEQSSPPDKYEVQQTTNINNNHNNHDNDPEQATTVFAVLTGKTTTSRELAASLDNSVELQVINAIDDPSIRFIPIPRAVRDDSIGSDRSDSLPGL